jgi:hypothetical protein
VGIVTDEQFEEFLKDKVADYHRPPAAPKEAMWAAIQASRRHHRPVRRFHRATWVGLAAGLVAALAVGIVIGRFSVSPGGQLPLAESSTQDQEDLGAAYAWATAQHLGQVETFLTGFRIDSRQGRSVNDASASASDLLSMTRFFLDSPAIDDPKIRTLLEDVELVLAQITRYHDQAPRVELELIDESIEQRSVLFRLRSAMSAAPAGTVYQGAL